tara:strand:+ start:625 stop:1467 length:843 start_codon:yes stop_codon:yes gene_type:complete
MKISKLLFIFIIILSINIYTEENIDEYKVEIIIFKYLNNNSDENFSSELKIPEETIIQFYNPDLYINKKALSNFSKNNSFFYNLFSNIKPNYINSETEDLIDRQYNPNPKNWFRESINISTLGEIKKKIINNSDIYLLDSKSWVQGVDDIESSKYLYYEDKVKEYGFFLKLYKKRFMHADIKSFIGINNKKIQIKPIETHINDLENKIYSSRTNKLNYDLSINYPNNNQNIMISKPNKVEELISATDLNIYIDEEKRIFNGEVHLFEHPAFGILLSIKKI